MRVGLRDIIFASVMLGFNGLIWLELSSERYQTSQAQDYGFDPAFFPQILLVLWALLCLLMIIRAAALLSVKVDAPLWRGFILAFLLVALYIVLMYNFGFLLSSIPFAAAFMLTFGYRQPIVVALVALIFPTLTWYIFVFLLHIPLPTSPWFIWV